MTTLAAVLLGLAVFISPSRATTGRPFFTATLPSDSGTPLRIAYALDLLALAMSGGAPAGSALMAVSNAAREGEIREVPGRVAAALRWGVDDVRAWEAAPPAWRPAATAFALAGRAGAAPADLLRRAADDVRRAENDRVAAAGARAGVRIVLPLGLCFLPAFLLITVVPLVLGLAGPFG